jgi:hypothetical protein
MDTIKTVIARLRRIDNKAADYVQQRLDEGTLWRQDREYDCDAVVGLFTWSSTPQGYDYWCRLSRMYRILPKITEKGNSL